MTDPRLSVPTRPAPDLADLDPYEAEHIERTHRRIRARAEAKSRLSAPRGLLERVVGAVKAVAHAVAIGSVWR